MCESTTTPAAGQFKDPVSMRAARIASLATAANLVLTGSSLADPRHVEAIVIDVMDAIGVLAAQLANDTEDLVFTPAKGA